MLLPLLLLLRLPLPSIRISVIRSEPRGPQRQVFVAGVGTGPQAFFSSGAPADRSSSVGWSLGVVVEGSAFALRGCVSSFSERVPGVDCHAQTRRLSSSSRLRTSHHKLHVFRHLEFKLLKTRHLRWIYVVKALKTEVLAKTSRGEGGLCTGTDRADVRRNRPGASPTLQRRVVALQPSLCLGKRAV